jgi:hypothetical protein
MMNKFKMTLLAALAAASTAPASAAVYNYTMSNGDVLSINSTSGSGTWTGASINTSFASPAFTSFTGGQNLSHYMADLNSISGYITINGKNEAFSLTPAHPPMLILDGTKATLWATWGTPPVGGDYINTVSGYTTSTSSGGTDVPAPAMPLLLGLGAAGLAYRARRVKARMVAA